MKKIILYICVALMGFLGLTYMTADFAYAQLKPNNPFVNAKDTGEAEGVNILGAASAGETGGGQGDALINVIKGAVNWVLGILALIALLVLMYGGFQMVTAAGNEDQYGQGFKILKQAAAGLAMIGIAWFIVSIIFFVIELVGRTSVGQGAGTDV